MSEPTETSSPPFKAVIILTYMRSGSSLTGDILQHSPGAFYVYEPLHRLERLAKKPGSEIQFVNGTVRKWPFDYKEEAVDILRHWLTCDVTKLTTEGLMDGFLGFGTKSKEFLSCFKKTSVRVGNKTAALSMCIPQLQASCEESPIRILKVLRISLKAIGRLLNEVAGLKIIHLIRDPRATLKSQAALGMCISAKGGFYGCSNKFCTALENNELEQVTIAKKYPDRILNIFYEDIAKDPTKMSKHMYDFIGTTFTAEAEKYIFNITMAGNPNNCNICTTRSNASIHIDSWKKTITPSFLSIIEDRCNYVLRRYNYSFYSKQDKPSLYL